MIFQPVRAETIASTAEHAAAAERIAALDALRWYECTFPSALVLRATPLLPPTRYPEST